MSIFDKIFRVGTQQDNNDEKVIDLSDSTKYPASVLSDLDCTFALGDDSENFLSFLHGKWCQPIFHWGWDDITHEEAVNSEFLQRAFYGLDCQNKKRRDAMIASEGCQFVWKDKRKEPVPGLITGEELCRYLTRSREWGLKSMKDINAREDRDARRWRLNPTFDDLMADWGKSDDQADYYHRDLGYGMLRFSNRSYGNKQIFIVNPAIKKVYPISEPNGKLVGFTLDDIDWDNVNQLEHNGDAKRLVADYGGLSIGDYKDGIAYVSWMLYPDGRYFADEDGFGMEDNDEVNIAAYIDTQCQVVVKFQDMEDDEKRRKLREEALSAISKEELDKLAMKVFEQKALEFVSKIDSIIQNNSQENIDSLFSVLNCLSLKQGYHLGLKLASEVGLGDESCFYTYQGDDPTDSFSCRVPDDRILCKDIIVEPSAMGAWQAYLLYISPTILPTFWHGGYIRREYFFDRENYKGITSGWARGKVDIKLNQIPQPTVEMSGFACVTCPYWNDWEGLVQETVDVDICREGTILRRSQKKVLYKYDCGICY